MLFVSGLPGDVGARSAVQRWQVDLQHRGRLTEIAGYFLGALRAPGSLRVDAMCLPVELAGGDYCALLEWEERYVGMVVADACGHGMPAADLLAASIAATVNNRFELASPAVLLQQASKVLLDAGVFSEGKFVTAGMIIMDSVTLQARLALAGHPSPVLWRGGAPVRLGPLSGSPLGILSEPSFEEADIQFEPGDQLALFTDGVMDSVSVDGSWLDSAAVRGALETAAGSLSPARTFKNLIFDLGGDGWQKDDASAMFLRVLAAQR